MASHRCSDHFFRPFSSLPRNLMPISSQWHLSIRGCWCCPAGPVALSSLILPNALPCYLEGLTTLKVGPCFLPSCSPALLQWLSGEAALCNVLLCVWAEIMSAFTSCMQTIQAGSLGLWLQFLNGFLMRQSHLLATDEGCASQSLPFPPDTSRWRVAFAPSLYLH